MRDWSLDMISIGSLIKVRIINKAGDRNLDGTILSGTVAEIIPSRSMAKLHSGWCVHTKDDLLEHQSPRMSEIVKREAAKVKGGDVMAPQNFDKIRVYSCLCGNEPNRPLTGDPKPCDCCEQPLGDIPYRLEDHVVHVRTKLSSVPKEVPDDEDDYYDDDNWDDEGDWGDDDWDDDEDDFI